MTIIVMFGHKTWNLLCDSCVKYFYFGNRYWTFLFALKQSISTKNTKAVTWCLLLWQWCGMDQCWTYKQCIKYSLLSEWENLLNIFELVLPQIHRNDPFMETTDSWNFPAVSLHSARVRFALYWTAAEPVGRRLTDCIFRVIPHLKIYVPHQWHRRREPSRCLVIAEKLRVAVWT